MDDFDKCPRCGSDVEHIHVYAGEEIVRCVATSSGCDMPYGWGERAAEAWTNWRWHVACEPSKD